MAVAALDDNDLFKRAKKNKFIGGTPIISCVSIDPLPSFFHLALVITIIIIIIITIRHLAI